MSDTATRILDAAQELIQTRGYNAFSFNDVAEKVGIKKPSVIHHFASKSILGVKVVSRYRQYFSSLLEKAASDKSNSAMDMFDFYCTPYTDFGKTNDKVCLCGAMAGEFMALPEEVKKEVSIFFEEHISWLEKILRHGQSTQEFDFSGTANMMARLILSSMQGALIAKRATGDDKQIFEVITALKSSLLKK